MVTVNGVDPAAFSVLASFKAAVYDEAGAGTWLDDMKLELVWRETHDEPIPDHLKPLTTDD